MISLGHIQTNEPSKAVLALVDFLLLCAPKAQSSGFVDRDHKSVYDCVTCSKLFQRATITGLKIKNIIKMHFV